MIPIADLPEAERHAIAREQYEAIQASRTPAVESAYLQREYAIKQIAVDFGADWQRMAREIYRLRQMLPTSELCERS